MSKVIELKNISFSYKKNQIFGDFSVDFYEKKISFLLGKNGSGKTTLLKLLNGFLEPDMGDVYINGKKLHTYSQQYLSKTISYVPQNINAADGFSVLDYLVLGRYPYIKYVFTAEDYDIAKRMAIEIGIDNILHKTMLELSGGEKQLISITRALIQDTPIIIMDEPMSALDLENQAEVLDIIKKLQDRGKTVILTTHNPMHTFQIDSMVYLLHDGRIISQGSTFEVINNENIQAVYGDKVSYNESMQKIAFELS